MPHFCLLRRSITMKHLPLIALALLVSFSASSFADNNYKVLGNYKELKILVEPISENSVGVTKEDLERTLKLRLMKNGIKPRTDFGHKHNLYLNVTVVSPRGGYAASILVTLNKASSDYVSPDHGASSDHLPLFFTSSKDRGIFMGSTKSHFLEDVEQVLDTFILKYLEANME